MRIIKLKLQQHMRKIKMSHDGNSRVYDQLYDECLNMTVGEFQDWLEKNVSNDKIKNSNHLAEWITLYCETEFDNRCD